jgi:hypothetical protein
VKLIMTRAQMMLFAQEHGLRLDWHEPDEQGITARVEGTPLDFDNAGYWPMDLGFGDGNPRRAELHVIFSELCEEEGQQRRGRDLAAVNLATLCAWASEPRN